MRAAALALALSLAALPAAAEESVAKALTICELGAADPAAADAALLAEGYEKSTEGYEGTVDYFLGQIYVMMWDQPGFCMVDTALIGTAEMAALLQQTLVAAPLGPNLDGCEAYALEGGLTATLTSSGNDPTCTSETDATLRFELPQ